MLSRVVAVVLLLATGCAAEQGAGPSGEPVKIGYLNNASGAFAVPELQTGAEVAVAHLNRGGGVRNRPFELITCPTDGTPEQSDQCAAKFVAENVAVVVQGVDTGADAAMPKLAAAAIPLVGHVQFTPGLMNHKNAFFFGAAAVAYGTAALKYYADQDVKTVAWLLPESPTTRAFTDTVLAPAAQRFGLGYRSVYYPADHPDWESLARTVMTAEASGSIAATEDQCTHIVRALREASYDGRILAASCTGLSKSVGNQSIGVELSADFWHPTDPMSAPPANQDEIEEYRQAMKDAGHDEPVAGAVVSFADIMTLARVLSTSDGTPEQALRAVKNLDSFLGPQITCDHAWFGNSACSTAVLFYRFQPNGALKAQIPDFIEVAKLG
ncbi:ABC transporter substrate-binding protein [Lentzea sp. BCCO 10_0856]|uniref:ABC transporter substrate-binding protein n=1 Tax=Lentzea miocenica TaxID=3095431 RepID=A0ABU4SRZ9_9PSEU|nr:ABC transporter substrate-binding protein [Lentzea sp. BCCO 10_0856]MDX8028633.1 ABC transporter substrate-binding protein [Lentzea sp. BCCO 10_0856]